MNDEEFELCCIIRNQINTLPETLVREKITIPSLKALEEIDQNIHSLILIEIMKKISSKIDNQVFAVNLSLYRHARDSFIKER